MKLSKETNSYNPTTYMVIIVNWEYLLQVKLVFGPLITIGFCIILKLHHDDFQIFSTDTTQDTSIIH